MSLRFQKNQTSLQRVACHWWPRIRWTHHHPDILSLHSGCCALGIGYMCMISTGAQYMNGLQCPWVEWWDASIHARALVLVVATLMDALPYYRPSWLPVIPHRLAYHWTDFSRIQCVISVILTKMYYVHGMYRWLGGGVQYLRCVSDGSAAVLLWTTNQCISTQGHDHWFRQCLGNFTKSYLNQYWQIVIEIPYSCFAFVLPPVFMIECKYNVSAEIDIF